MADEPNSGWEPSISPVGKRCCGCGACSAICPAVCLPMKPDGCGFLYPEYKTGCIGCGKCGKVCPVLSRGREDSAISVEWAKSTNELRRRSSSGAVFGLLALSVLNKGGVVYGAAFANDCKKVEHIRIDDSGSIDAIMRSKYVQSAVDKKVYEDVGHDLRDGQAVLYSGTTCQIAAMRNYLDARKIPRINLLLVDVICHGVPSPRLWSEWLDWISCEEGQEIKNVNFRNKSNGWSNFSVAYYTDSEEVRNTPNSHDWYMRAFLQNATLRQSCLECPAKRRCGSDITLGDFWGIHSLHPKADEDDLGVSAVICNTEKGAEALNRVRSVLETGPSSFDEVVAGNSAIVRSVKSNPNRDALLADLDKGMSIRSLMKKWPFERSLSRKLCSKIMNAARKVIRK